MSQLVGVWNLVESENFDEYMKGKLKYFKIIIQIELNKFINYK